MWSTVEGFLKGCDPKNGQVGLGQSKRKEKEILGMEAVLLKKLKWEYAGPAYGKEEREVGLPTKTVRKSSEFNQKRRLWSDPE